MEITGSINEIKKALFEFYLKKGLILKKIEILKNFDFKAESISSKKTINELLDEASLSFSKNKRKNLTRLKSFLLNYFMNADFVLESYDLKDYNSELVLAEKFMDEKDAFYLSIIKKEELMKFRNAGQGTWDLLNFIVENYLTKSGQLIESNVSINDFFNDVVKKIPRKERRVLTRLKNIISSYYSIEEEDAIVLKEIKIDFFSRVRGSGEKTTKLLNFLVENYL